MKIKPAGYFVLVDVKKAEEKSEGGILLTQDYQDKLNTGEETGVVIAFGPTCFVGMRGCEATDRPAHEQWGVSVGDKVEFKKYEGKRSYIKGFENYRYIPDTHILGVVHE